MQWSFSFRQPVSGNALSAFALRNMATDAPATRLQIHVNYAHDCGVHRSPLRRRVRTCARRCCDGAIVCKRPDKGAGMGS